VIKAIDIEDTKKLVESVPESELEIKKELILSDLIKSWKHPNLYPEISDYNRECMIEVLVWADLKLEGIAFTGAKSWWYRAKRRVYYANKMRKGEI